MFISHSSLLKLALAAYITDMTPVQQKKIELSTSGDSSLQRLTL